MKLGSKLVGVVAGMALLSGQVALAEDASCKKVRLAEVGWSDMLTHYRVVRLKVEGMGPATVAIDAHGHSLYADAALQAQTRLQHLMDELDAGRAS